MSVALTLDLRGSNHLLPRAVIAPLPQSGFLALLSTQTALPSTQTALPSHPKQTLWLLGFHVTCPSPNTSSFLLAAKPCPFLFFFFFSSHDITSVTKIKFYHRSLKTNRTK